MHVRYGSHLFATSTYGNVRGTEYRHSVWMGRGKLSDLRRLKKKNEESVRPSAG